MAHPVHAILRRILGTEQYAFDARTPDIWPWERSPWSSAAANQADGDPEPTQFDDVYPWLEPAN